MAYYDDYRHPTPGSRRPSLSGGVPFPSSYDQYGSPFDQEFRHATSYPESSFIDGRYPAFPRRRSVSSHRYSPFDETSPVDGYYDDYHRSRTMSSGSGYYGQPGSGAVVIPPPLTPHPSQYSKPMLRRASTSGMYGGYDGFAGAGHPRRQVKFRVKNGWTRLHSGVSLGEALGGGVRLSHQDAYTYRDMAVDSRGKMFLRVVWEGYRSLTYEIPVSGFDGIVHLQSLLRRIGRSIEHFLRTSMISIPYERVIISGLDPCPDSYDEWLPIIDITAF